ncbi:MAG: amino acid ABC transporter substrate-binding protein [Sphingobacteriales bacterium]|nr:MAG: amino acid ABC transporter substrate-binding protein [Sphingobacteriales bacterium]TAF80372.1 MAG: amino acid ABC transporter substrate-binding protein [Sphingobacteriales bacterium]
MKLLTTLKELTGWCTILVRNRQQPLSGNNLFLGIVFLALLGACSPKIITPVKPPVAPPVVVKPVEKPAEINVETAIKNTEKANQQMLISLVLPFGLDKINSATAMLPQMAKANLALDYYQGFKMALDSVAILQGANFKLQVYDSGDDVVKTNALILKKEIKTSDLIVGPVFPNAIKAFSNLSKTLKIPLVSPLAPQNPNTFNNPYLLTINNTLNQHTYTAAAFIKNTLKPKKILLIRSGQADEYKYANPFKKGIDSLAKGLAFAEVGIKAIGYQNINLYLTPTGNNVIVLPATDETFLEAVFKELVKLSATFKITVIGHPNWEKATFLNIETLQQLNTYITASYQINYKQTAVINFIKNYHNKYSLEPSEYSFKGFDTGFYLATLMANQGKNYFTDLVKYPYIGLHNHFNFIKNSSYGYFNGHVLVLKYQNFELVKAN